MPYIQFSKPGDGLMIIDWWDRGEEFVNLGGFYGETQCSPWQEDQRGVGVFFEDSGLVDPERPWAPQAIWLAAYEPGCGFAPFTGTSGKGTFEYGITLFDYGPMTLNVRYHGIDIVDPWEALEEAGGGGKYVLLAGEKKVLTFKSGELGETGPRDPSVVQFLMPGTSTPDPKIQVLSAGVYEHDPYNADLTKTLVVEVEVAEDNELGLRDLELDCGELQETLDEAVTVVRVECVDLEGDVRSYLPTINSKLLNPIISGGGVPEPLYPIAPSLLTNPYEVKVSFAATPGAGILDQATITLESTVIQYSRTYQITETGIDTNVFEYVEEDGVTVIRLELVNPEFTGRADEFVIRMILPATEYGVIEKRVKESGANSLLFESQRAWARVTFVANLNEDVPDEVRLDIRVDDGQHVNFTLVETGSNTRVFVGADGQTQVRIKNLTGFASDKKDLASIIVSSQSQGVTMKTLDVLETTADSIVFETVIPTHSIGAGALDPTPSVPTPAAFKIRITNPDETKESIAILFGGETVDGGTVNWGEIELSLVSTGVYESKPIWLVREYDKLLPGAEEVLSDYIILRGEGSDLSRVLVIMSGSVCHVTAKKRKFRGLVQGSGEDSTSLDAMEQEAPKHCWEDSDEEWFFSKKELLGYLKEMGVKDIFVYHGHTSGANLKDTGGNKISIEDLEKGMGETSPGVVVLLGCSTHVFKDTFKGKGCRIFFGFDEHQSPSAAAVAGKVFMMKLFAGESVADAKKAAHEAMIGELGHTEGTNIELWASNDAKSLYQNVGVDDKK